MVSQANGHFPSVPQRCSLCQVKLGASGASHHRKAAMNISLQQYIAAGSRPLAGKVSLVTGSTSGIGLGIARALAAAGSAVMLNGLGDAAEIARTKDQLAADCGVTVSYSSADMTRPEAITDMIAT